MPRITRRSLSEAAAAAAAPGPAYQFDVPIVEEGVVVPVIYGTQWLNGILLQFGGKGTSLTYPSVLGKLVRISFWVALCFGKAEIKQMRLVSYRDTTVVDEWEINILFAAQFNDGTGSYYPSGLVDNFGNALEYVGPLPGIAHQYFNVRAQWATMFYFVEGGGLNRFSFKMHRVLSGVPIPGADLSDGSSNPVAVIYDMLTNTQYGGGVPTSVIDTESFVEAAQFMVSKNIGINITIIDRRKIRETVDKICGQAGLTIWKDRYNKYKIRAYNPDDVLNYDDTMDDSEFINFQIDRIQLVEMPNEFKFTIKTMLAETETDPEFINQTEIVNFSNSAMYSAGDGVKIIEEYNLSYLTRSAAMKRMSDTVYERTYPRKTIICDVNMKYSDIEPMDLIMVTNTEHDLNNVPFRVESVDLGEIEENLVRIKMSEATEIGANISQTINSGLRDVPSYSATTDAVNLTFPAYSNTSIARVPAFTDESAVIVTWGKDQQNEGDLVRFVDYTITGGNKIVLTQPKWTSTIESNTLGLLNIDAYEAT